MYVTKNANYITKPEEKSTQYKDLVKNQIASAAATGAAPDATVRAVLFDICKRDYSSQEIASIALQLPSCASSCTFVHCSWTNDAREALPGDKKGLVLTKLSDWEVYLHRMDILKAHEPKKPEEKAAYKAQEGRLQGLGFLDFFKAFQVLCVRLILVLGLIFKTRTALL